MNLNEKSIPKPKTKQEIKANPEREQAFIALVVFGKKIYSSPF